jgi:membrane protease YdiL (CAAX protease family)
VLPSPDRPRHRLPRELVLELALFGGCFLLAMFLAGAAAGDLEAGGELQTIPLLVGEVVLCAVVVPAIALLQRRRGQTLADLGLARPRSWRRVLAIGAALGVAIKVATIPIGLVAYALGARGDTLDVAVHGPVDFLAFVAVGSLAAFVEELVFRGYLRDRFARCFGQGGAPRLWPTGFVTSLLFAIGHGYQGLLGIVVTAFVGVAQFHIASSPRWGLVHGIVAHATFNAIAVVSLGCAEAFER